MQSAPLVITFYALFLAQSISSELVKKDLGPLHIHVNTTKLPPQQYTPRWDDRHATLKATLLVNFVKALPQLNPFKSDIIEPYNAIIPDLEMYGIWLTFENIIVTGIKEITLLSSKGVDVQLSPPRIGFNVSVPNITIEADFNLTSTFDNNLPIQDVGHFKATLLDLNVTAVFGPKSVKLPTRNVYQLESAAITMDFGSVQLQIDTIYAEEVKLVLDEFYKHSEDIVVDNDVLNIILEAINEELAKVPEKKISDYLLGASEPNLTQFRPDRRSGRRSSGRKYG